jgi:hypothetical protein
MDQRQPRQQDRDREPDRGPRHELRSSGPASRQPALDHDSGAGTDTDLMDDPAINTHGSER